VVEVFLVGFFRTRTAPSSSSSSSDESILSADIVDISEIRRERRRLFLEGGSLLPESSLDARLAFLCPVEDVDVTDDGVADLLNNNESEVILGTFQQTRNNYLEESCPRVRPRLAGTALPLGTEELVRVVPCP
jgi:hypothetical protein